MSGTYSCSFGSQTDCLAFGSCGAQHGPVVDDTMALDHVTRWLWVAGSCPTGRATTTPARCRRR